MTTCIPRPHVAYHGRIHAIYQTGYIIHRTCPTLPTAPSPSPSPSPGSGVRRRPPRLLYPRWGLHAYYELTPTYSFPLLSPTALAQALTPAPGLAGWVKSWARSSTCRYSNAPYSRLCPSHSKAHQSLAVALEQWHIVSALPRLSASTKSSTSSEAITQHPSRCSG